MRAFLYDLHIAWAICMNDKSLYNTKILTSCRWIGSLWQPAKYAELQSKKRLLPVPGGSAAASPWLLCSCLFHWPARLTSSNASAVSPHQSFDYCQGLAVSGAIPYSLSGKSQCRWKLAATCVTVGSDYVFRAVLAISSFFSFSFSFNGETIDLLSFPSACELRSRILPANVFW